MIWLALTGFILTMTGYIQWVFADYKYLLAHPLRFRAWQFVFWIGIALLDIFYHVAKLQKATKDNNLDGIREYAADVANMAMMLADVCGVLEAIQESCA